MMGEILKDHIITVANLLSIRAGQILWLRTPSTSLAFLKSTLQASVQHVKC